MYYWIIVFLSNLNSLFFLEIIMDVSICSYNCCSVKKNIDIIRELTNKKVDIIFLQETFLLNDNLSHLEYVDENYFAVGVGATYSESAIVNVNGRPSGGMAILWRKNVHFDIKLKSLDKDFMVIDVIVGLNKFTLVNLYIRSDLGDVLSYNNYLENLHELENIIDISNTENILFFGDFNADPHHGRAWRSLSDFMGRCGLKCYDYELLPTHAFTYVSYSDSHCKWLDHLIGRMSEQYEVTEFDVLSDLIGSDHLPLFFNLHISIGLNNCIDNNVNLNDINHINDKLFVDWNSLDGSCLREISSNAVLDQENFRDFSVNTCLDDSCNSNECKKQINEMYRKIVDSVCKSSQNYIKRNIKKNKYKVIPGWNRHVKDIYKDSKEHYKRWILNGRLRYGLYFEIMKQTKSRFKEALNKCKSNEQNEIFKSIDEKLRNKNYNDFWKEVRNKKGRPSQPSVIDNSTNSNDILSLFTEKFLPSVDHFNHNVQEGILLNRLNVARLTDRKAMLTISSNTLIKHTNKLNDGMGHDFIHSKLLKFATREFLENFTLFFNVCFYHRFIPLDLLKGEINPILKDKSGLWSDSSNYRPVMQSSCILKILESIILEYLDEKIHFNSRQFGFVGNHSTSHPCLLLKEILFEYTKNKSSSYGLFIDLSKAFDRVNHFKLGSKLLDRGIPSDLVEIIMVYLRNQMARVRWCDSVGEYRYINRGVRQGGKLSPFLFKFFIDELLNKISNLDEGCMIGLSRINILAYADDMVLLANDHKSLCNIYSVFKDEINNLDLVINENKSKCVIFNRNRNFRFDNEIILGNSTFEVADSIKYLGNVISRDLDETKDITFKLHNFYKNFNSVFRAFNNVSVDTFLFLFNSYCCPRYGTELWPSNAFRKQIFKTFEVAYCNSLKRILGVPKYSRNHWVAEVCDIYLLRHHVAVMQALFLKRILECKSYIFVLNSYFLKNGFYLGQILNFFRSVYNVNIMELDAQTIHSRVKWTQLHET